MSDPIKDLLAKRRDRVIAIILGVKEKECDSFLSDEAQMALRKVVLDQMNDYYHLCLDVLRSLEPGTIMNEAYLAKIDEIHEVVTTNGNTRVA